jgi:glycosidase
MQWDVSPHGGFSPPDTAATWLPTTLDRGDRNVESQLQDPTSILALHRALLRYRNSSATLQTGDYHPVDSPAGCYSFERTSGGSRTQVALNFTDHELQVPLIDSGTVALSTHLDRKAEKAVSTMTLRPNEGVIVELRQKITPTPAE